MPTEQDAPHDTSGPVAHVRLFGGLTVERADGTAVPTSAWRTGKTMDLLRLLALENGEPVRADVLTGTLWPNAPRPRALGSLRTAASEIRRVIGTNCVERQHDGLVLTDVWVDVPEFVALSQQVANAARHDRCQEVVGSATAAEALYVGDFRAYDDDGLWAVAQRESLRRTRGEVLTEAATCALHLGLHREARYLGRTAISILPTSEAAHRALMAADAELGEIAGALETFEVFRRRLAEELGADPSVQTRELHVRLLRGSDPGEGLSAG